jgi:hypothetical protein
MGECSSGFTTASPHFIGRFLTIFNLCSLECFRPDPGLIITSAASVESVVSIVLKFQCECLY